MQHQWRQQLWGYKTEPRLFLVVSWSVHSVQHYKCITIIFTFNKKKCVYLSTEYFASNSARLVFFSTLNKVWAMERSTTSSLSRTWKQELKHWLDIHEEKLLKLTLSSQSQDFHQICYKIHCHKYLELMVVQRLLPPLVWRISAVWVGQNTLIKGTR